MHRPKRSPQKKVKGVKEQNQMGIFSIPDFNLNDEVDDDDDDLEAELMNILSSDPPKPKPRTKAKVPSVNLDAMVAESLKDIPSDASLSGDDDDPELLAEFDLVTGGMAAEEIENKPEIIAPTHQNQDYVKLIEERLRMYEEAEQNARTAGDASKGRRLARGLKTLNELLKKAKSGGVINESDIPLPVATSASKAVEEPLPEIFQPVPLDDGISRENQPSPVVQAAPATEIKVDDSTTEVLIMLKRRRDQYKSAAVSSKRSGDIQMALTHVKIAKQFDSVIAAVEGGQPVDLSDMPPPPPGFQSETSVLANKIVPVPKPSEKLPLQPSPIQTQTNEQSLPTTSEGSESVSPKTPSTVLEALEQRLARFKEQEEAGKRDGNAGKARRNGRIVKQYQDAIKLHNAGKPIPIDDLPTPPGFAPIPVGAPPSGSAKPTPVISPNSEDKSVQDPSAVPGPAPKPSRPAPSPPGPQAISTSPQGSTGTVTRQEKQLFVLRQKQKQFKEAAMKAKQTGNIELAKEFLRKAKCFDPLIEASISGLPVDMSSLPAAPGSKDSIEKEYEIVKLSDCIPGTTSEIYTQLITDLQNQIKTCIETRAHFKAVGDIASANRFENLAVNTKKDLDTVKIASNKDDPVPRFHYEMKTFSIIKCNTDLNDNDVELTIVQGVNYNVPNPKEIDTYVRFEFPYPTDDPKKDKTSTIYNTNNPVYDSVFVLAIQRAKRECQRIFKRHAIKLEIWSKGFIMSALCGLCSQGNSSISGFLRSDVLIGTVNVKLLPLESNCTIHDSFDLMNGKKVVGGKLEVKVRMRDPIRGRQLEKIQEKWLLID